MLPTSYRLQKITALNLRRISTQVRSQRVPCAWLGTTFKDGGAETSAFAVKVGAPTNFTMLNLPFYLFGASPTTQDGSIVLNSKTNLSDAKKWVFQKLPIANFQSINHPAQMVQWSYVIAGRGRLVAKL